MKERSRGPGKRFASQYCLNRYFQLQPLHLSNSHGPMNTFFASGDCDSNLAKSAVKLLACILLVTLAGMPGEIFAQNQADSLDQSIADLIYALDEATSTKSRREILGKLKSQGSKVIPALEKLPKDIGPGTRLLLEKLKSELEKQLDKKTLQSARFSLQGNHTLQSALKEITAATGVEFALSESTTKTLRFDMSNVEFWKGLDLVLDLFERDIYAFSKPGTIQIIQSDRTSPRTKNSAYASVARLELVRYSTAINLVKKNRNTDRIELDFRWEPRFTPYQIYFDHSAFSITDANQGQYRSRQKGNEAFSVNPNESAKRIEVQFDAIPRSIETIKSIAARIIIKTPVGRETFRFRDISAFEKQIAQRKSAMVVTVSATEKDKDVFRVAMQFQLDNPMDSLDSHQGWMFRNQIYLEDPKQNRILPFKTMTTVQKKDKMGFVYSFRLPSGPAGFDFVYESPTSIREVAIPFELGPIDLNSAK